MGNTIETPSFIELTLNSEQEKALTKALTYTDKQALQIYNRFRKNRWYLTKHGEEAFYDECERLKGLTKQCLLLTEGPTGFRTLAGLESLVEAVTGQTVTNKVVYPESKLLPWAKSPTFNLHYYQNEAVESLLAARHASIELSTGLGKSYIILYLVKKLGLKTTIIAPSVSIAEQLYQTVSEHLGTKRVGKCYGSKKDASKLVTVALPQTLTKLVASSKEYLVLAKTQVLIVDESHTVAAKTLSEVCFGLLAEAPYRFFVSATQMRNDGKDLLLEGITGPIVYAKSLAEGVNEGFLAKPTFNVFNVHSSSTTTKTDPNDLTRVHLYYNPVVIKQAATLANNFVKHFNHSVLILIDEVEQFTKLLPYFEHTVGFAHGPLGENKAKVPKAYWESEPNELVKQFNAKTLPILVGTSCISTGTDVKVTDTLIYLQGGKSEIQVKQAIGRGTRITPTKKECVIIDFDVVTDEVCHRHAEARREIYNSMYGTVKECYI